MPFTPDFESGLPPRSPLPVVDIFQHWRWLLMIRTFVRFTYYFNLSPILRMFMRKFMHISPPEIDILVRPFYFAGPWFWYPKDGELIRYIRRHCQWSCGFASPQIHLRWFTSGGCYTSSIRMASTLSTTTSMRGVSVPRSPRIYSSTTITSVCHSQMGTMR